MNYEVEVSGENKQLNLESRIMRLKFLICALAISFYAMGQKAVPELWNTRVHDDAKVLKHETIDHLEKQLAHYEDSTSNQIAILIISSLEGEAIEQYSIRVAEVWNLGQKDKDNGVLLLIAIDDHKMRIEVGHGLEGVLTDALSSRIIRNEMAPDFRRGDYDAGVIAAITAITHAIAGEYKAEESTGWNSNWTIVLVVGILVWLIIMGYAFYKEFKRTPGANSSNTTSPSHPSKSSSSSSWSSSSSGSSFSGGGGSFGGGGSSGSW